LKPFSSKISDQLGMKFLAATDIGKLLPWWSIQDRSASHLYFITSNIQIWLGLQVGTNGSK
jgi:hypothetical protein